MPGAIAPLAPGATYSTKSTAGAKKTGSGKYSAKQTPFFDNKFAALADRLG
jgi:hypothetical protein